MISQPPRIIVATSTLPSDAGVEDDVVECAIDVVGSLLLRSKDIARLLLSGRYGYTVMLSNRMPVEVDLTHIPPLILRNKMAPAVKTAQFVYAHP